MLFPWLSLIFCEIVDIKTGCIVNMNGAYAYADKKELLIYRCWRAPYKDSVSGKERYSNSIWIRSEGIDIEVPYKTPESFYTIDNGSPFLPYVGSEDPRVFEFQKELYIYYTGVTPYQRYPYRSLVIHKLSDALNNIASYKFIEPHIKAAQVVEKNWLFIGNDTHINALYTLHPFVMGTVSNEKLLKMFSVEYDCLQQFEHAHIGSNAILLHMGMPMFAFIINIKLSNNPIKYESRIAWLASVYPYELYGISDPWKVEVEHRNFVFYQNVVAKDRYHKEAFINDTLIISGGVDDQNIFKIEEPAQDWYDLKMNRCKVI